MKKKNKKNIHNIIFLIISIVLVGLAFLPVVGLNAELELQTLNLTYNGFEIMFGKSINELSGYISVNGNLDVKIKLNIMTILVYFLPILGYGLMKLLKKDDQTLGFTMVVTFLISTVLTFLITNISNLEVSEYAGIGLLDTYVLSLKEVGFTPLYGTYIIGFILCVSTIYSFYVASRKNNK